MENNHLIINNWLKTYMIGPMEEVAEGDGGRNWRREFTIELLKRVDENNNPIYVFDPTLEEQNKIGMESETFHKKVKGWLSCGKNEEVKKYADLIWKGKTYLEKDGEGRARLVKILGDIDYVVNSNFLVARMNKGDSPCVKDNTLITMSDLSQKYIKDIKIGDKVLGVKTVNRKTMFVESIVSDVINQGKKRCITYQGVFNKITCTPEHRFMQVSKNKAGIYNEVNKLFNKCKKCFEINYINLNKDFYKGWIKGYVNHDFNLHESKTGVSASCLSDKLEEINVVKIILEKFHIKGKIKKIRSKKDSRFKTQKDFYYILSITDKDNFLKIKKLSNFRLKNREQKCGYITGAIDADGWYDKSDIRYSQSTVNFNNYNQMINILNDLEIKFTEQIRTRKGNLHLTKKYSCYNIQISKNNLFLFPSQLNYKRKIKDRVISRIVHHSKLQKKYYSKNIVYDITTQTGNFIANGFIVHNCGTFGEACVAVEHNIPIYVIQTMARTDYKGSFVHFVFASGGDFFKSQEDLLSFLDKKYNLTLRK